MKTRTDMGQQGGGFHRVQICNAKIDCSRNRWSQMDEITEVMLVWLVTTDIQTLLLMSSLENPAGLCIRVRLFACFVRYKYNFKHLL